MTSRVSGVFVGLVFALVGSLASDHAFAGNPAVARLRTNPKIGSSVFRLLGKSEAKIPVLVILKEQADLSGADLLTARVDKGRFVYNALREVALRTQKDLAAFFEARAVSYQRFHIMNMFAIHGATPELLAELAAREDVARIIGNPVIQAKLPRKTGQVSKSQEAIEPNVVKIGASKIWSELGVKGEGIVVAGQDTGVQWDHPALIKQYRGNGKNGVVNHEYSWHDAIRSPITGAENPCGFDIKAPCDDHSHGTHTIGTVVGDDGGSNKIGVAPGAQWIACRNMDAGAGTPASYIDCFEFFLAPYPQGGNAQTDGKPELAPHVINNSWGCPPSEGCQGDEILPALQAMYKAGIFVVASAGNEGSGCKTIENPPAYHTDITLSVGAADHRNDQIAFFSSRGPSSFDGGIGPDVTAPGVNVRSAVPGGRYEGSGWSGTSMAGPHAVGAVALLWSAKSSLIGDYAATTDALRRTAKGKTTTESCGGIPGSQVPNNTYGYGWLDAYGAVKSVIKKQ